MQVVPISRRKIFESWAECSATRPMPSSTRLLHAIDDLVLDALVGRMAPPGQHVGLGQHFVRQPVLRLLERGDARLHRVAQAAA